MLPYDEVGRSLQGPTDLRIIMPLTIPTPLSRPGLMVKKQHTNSLQDLFMSEEEGCVATFRTQADLQAHMDTGRHLRVTERETVYDLARKKWAENVTGIQSSHVAEQTRQTRASSQSSPTRKEPLQGWALKRQRKSKRATESVKMFLLEKFNRGVETGNMFTLTFSRSPCIVEAISSIPGFNGCRNYGQIDKQASGLGNSFLFNSFTNFC